MQSEKENNQNKVRYAEIRRAEDFNYSRIYQRSNRISLRYQKNAESESQLTIHWLCKELYCRLRRTDFVKKYTRYSKLIKSLVFIHYAHSKENNFAILMNVYINTINNQVMF